MKQHVGDDAQNKFIGAEELLRQALTKHGDDCTWYCKSFNPYPMVLTQTELEHQARLQRCLLSATELIVESYLTDVRLRSFLSLPDAAITILESLRNHPYKIGSYRPDFLHDTMGGIKVCEINARFPTNGYIISHYINNVIGELHPGLQRISKLDEIPEIFLSRFVPGSNVRILKERERGWDVVFLMHELKQRGYSCECMSAAEFKTMIDASGLVIELHQDELLREDPKWISQLCLERPHFNDLRTILLAHDKRMLGVFHNDEIMADYMTVDERKFLKENVVETHLVRDIQRAGNEAMNNKHDWVLKPNLLGKGEGMIFGHNTPENEWRNALRDSLHHDYVLQRYIKQKQFPILTRVGNDVSVQELNVVGTLLCFDDQFIGPGIYRASKGDIVNVSGGGTILFPMMERANA
ncbi:MAG: hypothetical protein SGJ27_27725 [Candidatus Melainabacteria bacterium]|nr:hypothetical protein [Candidatus Melainabacteria bacterium]